jgi:hypothetical protein
MNRERVTSEDFMPPDPPSGELSFATGILYRDDVAVGISVTIGGADILESKNGTLVIDAKFGLSGAMILARDIQDQLIKALELEDEDE